MSLSENRFPLFRDMRYEKSAGGERELVALLRLAFLEGTAAVHLRAAAPGAAELAVDEGRDAALAARGRELVGGDERVDCRNDECRLRRGERDEGLGLVG